MSALGTGCKFIEIKLQCTKGGAFRFEASKEVWDAARVDNEMVLE